MDMVGDDRDNCVTFAVGYLASILHRAGSVHSLLATKGNFCSLVPLMRSRILAHFMPEPVRPRPELARDLGVSHAAAVVVGTIIGSGIFLVPSEMMQAVGSAKLVYLAWIVGGLLSFFGALTYAELGAMKPQAGGEYVYVRDAYGPLGGFLYAWTCS